jgi:hypothetical protein
VEKGGGKICISLSTPSWQSYLQGELCVRTCICLLGLFVANCCCTAAQAELLHHWKFDETSGTTTADSAGSKNGTLVDSATFAAGVSGNALSLDGTNDNVDVSATPSPVDIINKSFSISFWAKRNTSTTADYVIGMGGAGTANQQLHIGFRDTDTFTFAFYSNDLNYDNLAVATDTNFHHWVVTFDTTTNQQRIYLDGNATPVASRTASNDFLGSNPNTFWIGRRAGSGTGIFFDGLIDDVQVYSDVLTGADAAFLFANPGTPVPVPEPGTWAMLGLGSVIMLATNKRRFVASWLKQIQGNV